MNLSRRNPKDYMLKNDSLTWKDAMIMSCEGQRPELTIIAGEGRLQNE